jgi:hypothetical protein
MRAILPSDVFGIASFPAFDLHFNANIFAVAFEDHTSVFKGAADGVLKIVASGGIGASVANLYRDARDAHGKRP